MTKRTILPALLLLAFPLAAQQTYTLKTRNEPAVGNEFTVAVKTDANVAMKFSDSSGKVLQNQEQVSTGDTWYVETTLAQENGHASHFTRDYKSATETTDGIKEARSYDRRVVTFRKNGNDYSVTSNAGQLTQEDTESLVNVIKERFEGPNEDEAILPKKPVHVGESWDVDLSAFTKDPNFGEVDAQRSRGTATLTRAYVKDGHQYATIEADIALMVKSISGMTFPEPAKFSMHYTMDGAMDGAGTQLEGKMVAVLPARMVVEKSGTKIVVDLTMNLNWDERHSAERPVTVAPKPKK